MYKERTKNETTLSLVIGLVLMIAISAICYFVGVANANSVSFESKTGFVLSGGYRTKYLLQLISTACPVISYSIAFHQVSKWASDGKHAMVKKGDGKDFVMRLWNMWIIIAGISAVAVAAGLFFWSFRQEIPEARAAIIKHNLWLVWLLQGFLTMIAGFLPITCPLKKSNS